MIQDVDETLRRLLVGELGRVNPARLTTPPRVTFEAPSVVAEDTERGAEPRLNVFLHDIRENTAQREESFVRIRPKPGVGTGDGEEIAGRRHAPVRLNLSYLVTAQAATSDAAHHLLADALAVLLRNPLVPERYWVGSLTENDEKYALPLSVAQPEHLGLGDPVGLWQALGGRLQPALGVTVTATFNPYETKWTKLVREVVLGFGQGTPESGGGPNRPLDLRGVRVSVAGAVLDATTQKPLPGVNVRVLPPSSQDSTPFRSAAEAATRTDDRGFFALLDLIAGPHRLRFERRGYLAQERDIVAPAPGRSDRMESLILPLAPAPDEVTAREETARLSGTNGANGVLQVTERARRISFSGVLRFPDGRPAAYIPVRAGDQRTITDGEGFYCFFEASDAPVTIIADVPGIGEVTFSAAEAAPEPADRGRRKNGS